MSYGLACRLAIAVWRGLERPQDRGLFRSRLLAVNRDIAMCIAALHSVYYSTTVVVE